MATSFEHAPCFTKNEAEFIDHSFNKTAKQLMERGCDPGWIVWGAMRASMEAMIILPPEEQLEFMESLEELIESLRDALPR